MGKNLASKYSTKIDERFTRESFVMSALNNDYEFTGVDTVNVYSLPVAPMSDYTRSGSNRYGTPEDLGRNVQTLKITRDRSFTFIIDRGDKIQSQMVSDAGKALSRQTNEVWIPEFDTYCFNVMANAAVLNGGFSDAAITKGNAYESFLAGMEWMGNRNVPDTARIAFCSYGFANLLKLDPAFTKQGDKAQDITIKGCIGEVDGCKIVRVPSSRLPAGCAFMIVHKSAATAPKQLQDYKIHDNPPGINGWLCEGRCVYDCFVLNEKADGIYYHGKQGVLKNIAVMTSPVATSSSETSVIITTLPGTGHSYVYKVYNTIDDKPEVAYGTALTDWTAVASGEKIAVTADNAYIMVAEVDADKNPVGVGTARINVA